MLRNMMVLGLGGLLGCGGGVWSDGEQVPTLDSGSPQEKSPDGGVALKNLVWLNAGWEHSFPTYIFWGSTTWRITNKSSVSVPFEVHCRARSRYYSGTLEPGQVEQKAWQCRGDSLRVKNLGEQDGKQWLEVYTE